MAVTPCTDVPLLPVPVETMRAPVLQGETRSRDWRLEQLGRIERLLNEHQDDILQALAADLGKPAVEAWFEVAAVQQEIALVRRRLRRWMARRPVPVPLSLQPAAAWQQAEPLGCVLVIGPWNYPLSLALQPLVSALAAGNTVVLKPSEHAPHTAELLARLLAGAFDPSVVQVVCGDGTVASRLLLQRFDHIFFTGGERVGRLVMSAAAAHLTPVTLELGGKSPVIVLEDADLDTTARRLAWGKGLNGGQTCVAPDTLLVQRSVREGLLEKLDGAITALYGTDPLTSPDLGSIVNEAQFQRLCGLLEGARREGRILRGGGLEAASRRIEPTLVAVEREEDPLLQEEIFGPILPVLAVDNLEEAIGWVRRRPHPLALYLFSNDPRQQERLLAATQSGTVAFNDVVLQVAVPELPFGGVGESGMGRYHGESGFLTFSHQRSVMRRPFWLDLPLRYPPYGNRLPLIRRLMG
jgi:aldehyde dehydrogenase (NAD+)